MDATYSEIQELDPSKKGIGYANKTVTYLRMFWKRYVQPERASRTKKILFSEQSLDRIKDGYKDAEFLATCQFNNLGLLDSIRNTLTEELKKDPPQAEVKAVDPSAMSDRKKDLGLLKNRGIIQADLSALRRQIGLRGGYKFENKAAKSNIAEFDNMGLDETDPDDINFFAAFHRLYYEIGAQSLVNNVMSLNRFDEQILTKALIDILCVRCFALQAYVDKISGQIKYKYIYPETAFGVFGDSGDGSQDDARGWEDSLSVGDFLQLVGNEFDFERDWKKLLAVINFGRSDKYTGFERRGAIYECSKVVDLKEINNENPARQSNLGWSDCLRFRVPVGYIEWKTWEATSTTKRRVSDASFVDEVPFSYEVPANEVTEYFTESSYQQQWYGAYYLSNGSTNQYLFNYSKVYYQQFEGANDEYSTGTMIFYREPGSSAVEMVESDVEMIHMVYFRLLFLLSKAKPEEDVYVVEELIQLNKLFVSSLGKSKGNGTGDTVESMFEEIIKYMKANTIRLRAYPELEGRPVQQLPSLEGKRNGLDASATAFQMVLEWGEQRLARKILGNGMRLGGNPPSRESNKSEQNSVDASKNSTGYIYRLLQYGKERIATMTLLYAQDICHFKESIPYKYIRNLLGETVFNGLMVLDEISAHRFGIFVRDYNMTVAKNDLRQAAIMALQEKQITYPDYVMVTQTEDYKAASMNLSLALYKTAKKLRKQVETDQQFQQQLEQQKGQNVMAQLQFNRETMWGQTDKNVAGLIRGKQIEAQSKLDVKNATIAAEPEKQAAKTRGEQDVKYTEAAIEDSRPYGQA